ncbi:acyltransferase family protein [Nocardioides kribbensis]|uniref:acyltransferase family protein n=1 Tax=Nocardioides kribbensis TaxID=305517 RepID=UPI001879F642|nr:acyltransferase family protein [Nocardioides kribbensis]
MTTAPPAPRQPDRQPDRQVWADVAKGACILLVVLHHAVGKLYVPALMGEPGPPPLPGTDRAAGDGWLDPSGLALVWYELSAALKPVRMPLFFVVSGFFAAGVVRRPWPALRRRVGTTAWVYAVWLLLLAAYFSVERAMPLNRTQDGAELLADLVWASTGLWFLYALAVYVVLARLLVRWPRATLAGAALLTAATSWLPVDDLNRAAVLTHFVFFAWAAYRPQDVRRLAGPAAGRPGRVLLLVAAFVALLAAQRAAGLPGSADLLVLALLGVPLGLAVAVALAERPRVGAALARLGALTLPVYVLHSPLLALLAHAPALLPPPGSPVLALAWPVVVAAAAVAVCLALHRLLLAVGLDWLFALPRPVAARAPAGLSGPGSGGPRGARARTRSAADR